MYRHFHITKSVVLETIHVDVPSSMPDYLLLAPYFNAIPAWLLHQQHARPDG